LKSNTTTLKREKASKIMQKLFGGNGENNDQETALNIMSTKNTKTFRKPSVEKTPVKLVSETQKTNLPCDSLKIVVSRSANDTIVEGT
jgi:hypothetical protein